MLASLICVPPIHANRCFILSIVSFLDTTSFIKDSSAYIDASTGWFYICRDVVFYETIYLFAKLHPNVGAQLRKEIFLPDSLTNPSFTEAGNDYDQTILPPNPVSQYVDEATASTPIDNLEGIHHFMLPGEPLVHLAHTRSSSARTASAPGTDLPAPLVVVSGTVLLPPTGLMAYAHVPATWCVVSASR